MQPTMAATAMVAMKYEQKEAGVRVEVCRATKLNGTTHVVVSTKTRHANDKTQSTVRFLVREEVVVFFTQRER